MEITLQQLFKLMLRHIKLIAICAGIGLIGAFLVTKLLISPSYISTVKMYVSTPGVQSSSQDINALNYAQKVVNTYVEMLQTNDFAEQVATRAELSYTPSQINSMISYSTLNSTEVFQVQVTADTPEESKTIADTIASLAPERIKSMKDDATLNVVDAARLPQSPSSPNVPLNMVIGLLLGIILSVLFVLLRDLFDVTIKNEEDLAERYGLPVLAAIPNFEGLTGKSASVSSNK